MPPTDLTPTPGQGPNVTPSTAPGQAPGAAPTEVAAKPKGTPQYKLTEKAWIYDKLHEAGESIYWTAKPEFYMHPMNQAARDMVEKYKPERFEPFGGDLPVATDKN